MKQPAGYLSKREQQIMELVYQRERLTATEASECLPGTPSTSTTRTLLRILEDKGELHHVEEDGRNVYLPVRPRASAARQALSNVLNTFFKGSASDVVATLLSQEGSALDDKELARMEQLIREAREEGR